MKNIKEEILKDWKDFFWEKGKYERRPLGFKEYENWLSSAIDEVEKEVREEILSKLPEEGIKWMQEGNNKDRKGYSEGFNACLAQFKENFERILKDK